MMNKLMFYLFILLAVTSNGLPVDEPVELKDVGDLFVSTVEVDWFTAYETCRKHQMHLVSVLSEEDNNRIQAAAEHIDVKPTRFWTSGNDLGHRGDFSWFSKGTKVNEQIYHNWDPTDKHNTTGEACIDIGRDADALLFTWMRPYCAVKRLFMCEEAMCSKTERKLIPLGLKKSGDLYFSDFQADWESAFTFCQRNNMLLVSVETEQINRDIQQIAEKLGPVGEKYWISGTDLKIKGLRGMQFWTSGMKQNKDFFVWFGIGRSLADQAYLNWDSGEPNNYNGDEYCMQILIRNTPNVFTWDDWPCYNTDLFICVESSC